MPVENNYEIQEYTGNSSGRTFNFPFRCFKLEDLKVDVTSDGVTTELTLNTDYKVTDGLDNDGGMVTYPLDASLPALSESETLRIYRSTPMEQSIDYPTYQQAIENALDKVTMLLQEAVSDSAVNIANEAKEKVNEILSITASKANVDGSNINKESFITALGIGSNGEIDLSDLSKTDGSNIDVLAYKILLGIPSIVDDITGLSNSKVDTSGDNIQVEHWQTMLGIEDTIAVHPQTIVKGAVGEIPETWEEGWCDKPAQHIITSGSSELTIQSSLQVAAGVEGKVLLSNELESDTALDISSAIAQTNGTFYAYADIGTTGSMSFGYTEDEPQVAPTKQNLMKLNLNMTANSSPSPYVASASSNYSGRLPYLAFDGKIKQGLTTSWQQANSGDLHPWLQIDLGSSIIINKYSIHSNTGDALRTPISWTFQGSLDGSNWVDLDVVTDSTSWSKGEYRTFEFETDDSYRYFRLYNMSSEYPNYTNISEVELFRKLKGDFYNTSNHTHYDKDGNILKRVYLGEFEVADGAVEKIINYQHGTTCTLPVNDGEVLPVNSTYYLDKPYLGNAKADVRLFAEDKWGLPNWVSVNGSGYGTAAFITEGILSVVTGSARLYYGGTGYGAGEFSSYGTTSYLAKVTVTRDW